MVVTRLGGLQGGESVSRGQFGLGEHCIRGVLLKPAHGGCSRSSQIPTGACSIGLALICTDAAEEDACEETHEQLSGGASRVHQRLQDIGRTLQLALDEQRVTQPYPAAP